MKPKLTSKDLFPSFSFSFGDASFSFSFSFWAILLSFFLSLLSSIMSSTALDAVPPFSSSFFSVEDASFLGGGGGEEGEDVGFSKSSFGSTEPPVL